MLNDPPTWDTPLFTRESGNVSVTALLPGANCTPATCHELPDLMVIGDDPDELCAGQSRRFSAAPAVPAECVHL